MQVRLTLFIVFLFRFMCNLCFLAGRNKHASTVTWVQVVLNYVVSSGDDGTVKLWDLNTGDFIRNLVTLDSMGSGGTLRKIRFFEKYPFIIIL